MISVSAPKNFAAVLSAKSSAAVSAVSKNIASGTNTAQKGKVIRLSKKAKIALGGVGAAVVISGGILIGVLAACNNSETVQTQTSQGSVVSTVSDAETISNGESKTKVKDSVGGSEVSAADFEYEVYDDHVEITKYIGEAVNVNIPSQIENKPVTVIGEEAFQKGDIVSVTIPDTVTTIGKYAFFYCTSLTTVNFPQSGSLTTIVDGAFEQCFKLQSANIPDGVTEIGQSAFIHCREMTELTLPETLESIGGSAFARCEKLTSVTVPSGVKTFGKNIFGNCSALTDVTISEGITELPEAFLYCCTSLEKLTIPDSVTTMERGVAKECAALKDITLSKNLTEIPEAAFNACTALEGIEIPEGVTNIGMSAFGSCPAIKKAVIPGSVQKIGLYAFGDCYKSVLVIHGQAGSAAEKYANKEGFTFVAEGAAVSDESSVAEESQESSGSTETVDFKYDIVDDHVEITKYTGNDVNVTIPSRIEDKPVTVIGKRAFTQSKDVETVIIPDSVTTIGDAVFTSCGKLKKVTIADSVTEIGGNVFSGCESLEELTLPDSVTVIGEKICYKCVSLKEVKLSENLTIIAKKAFSECSALENITIPDSVTSIESKAFEKCDALTLHGGSAAEQYAKDNNINYSAN